MHKQPYLDRELAQAYDAGNRMPTASLRAWVDYILARGPEPCRRVLDVGAGTGAFSVAIAERPEIDFVLGVEASRPMLDQARNRPCHGHVGYAVGDAASLPVSRCQFHLALLSRVVHHLPDRRACARELHRVLQPQGVVVVRTTVRERLDSPVYRYWPQLLAADRRRFPSTDELICDFASAGLTLGCVEPLAQPVYGSLGEYCRALSQRPQSKLARLSQADFNDGLERLQRDADRETDPKPISERYDVLTFLRS